LNHSPSGPKPVMMLYGLIYGALTSGGYLWLKNSGVEGGLPLFTASCALLFILHSFSNFKESYTSLIALSGVVRGLLFGLAQCCLLLSQATHSTSNSMMTAVAGSITCSFLGHLILGERLGKALAFGLGLCILGIGATAVDSKVNTWAILGGVLQGLTAISARFMMRKKITTFSAVTSGLFYGALVGSLALSLDSNLSSIGKLSYTSVCIGGIVIVTIQYSFFLLYRFLDVQRASILSLSRIPWAHFFEWSIFQTTPSGNAVLASAFVVAGAAATLLKGESLNGKD